MLDRALHLFALVALASAAVACGSSPASTDATDNTADELRHRTPLCDDGALSSDRLQPDAQGGPDSRAHVSCEPGYELCRVDPNGPDSDVCGDPDHCYACSAPPSFCVQNVLCAINSHFDHTTCQCEPNVCIQNVLCAISSHFDQTACKCVPNDPPPTCLTLTCAPGMHCCSGPASNPPGPARCELDGTFCPL